MKFYLKGHIDYERGGAGNEKCYQVADVIFADSLEEAVTLSRAFIKSHRQKLLNTRANFIEAITLTLFDENETPRLKFKLVKQRLITSTEERKPGKNGTVIQTITNIIEPEHMKEEYL